ncbi:dihydrodipicolinate synthase family protein [Bradyrhizobium sp. CIAT3101]|uniref:dihydrodipicolinate synthase family protein n=1 Tax=Bradyrhizobium sp. CIAT3101 TaxID=439387 RepID=UPI0024B1B529|nr:dihydrodipicolinate synthase family protein [Bradyrhizobium sp. CIAT3101]WFU80727.1 dihydrodipicolinate synthase family protein [Bradyrhizobium sp. CIAT3101]
MQTQNDEVRSGLLPVSPTPFTESGNLDIEGQARVLDCMIDQRVDGICILANYSEQFLLSDDERNLLVELCLSHVAGRKPVMVTCSHFSTRIAAERARYAAERGASLVMLMPPYHGSGLKADEAHTMEHFARVGDAAKIPIMVQDAPLSGVTLSVPFLVRLAREVPLVKYFKIEVPFAAAKLRSLTEAGGAAIAGPFDGEEAITMMADLDAGATGTMSSALCPDLLRPVFDHHKAGRSTEAAAAYARVLPLINYENRQCGLRAAKTVMKEGNVIRCDAVRHPLDQIHPTTKAGLLELARGVNPLALRWGH